VKHQYKHTISLFPGTAGTETETNPRGPSAALEQENGEDDTEGKTEGGLDNNGGDGAIPLSVRCRLATNSRLMLPNRPIVADIAKKIFCDYCIYSNPKLFHTFSLSRASLTGLVARAMVPDWLESAIAINLAGESAEFQ
jgi:hypothetical protein